MGIGVLILLVVWFAASKAISLFDMSIGRRTAVHLSLANAQGVQVALQEQEWQNAENGLKLYAGDSLATRGSGDATLNFFDGTKIRLDTGTDLIVDTSENEQGGTSAITVTVRSGRIWIVTPETTTFTGAIVRTVKTANFTIEIPASANVLLSSTLINVMRASGVGAQATLTFTDAKPSLIIGEGQFVSLSEENKLLIEEGKDPYELRDPVTLELLKDPFLISSYAQMNKAEGTATSTPTGPSPNQTDDESLTVSSPENNASINAKTVIVAGTVGERAAQLTINGQNIAIKPNLSFTAELSLPQNQPTFVITVEAQDTQGVPLAKIERTVKNVYQIVIEPVRIKSPVGSGETLRTSLTEVEITGEVSPGIAGVRVNDYKLQLFKPGSKTWSYLASVDLGNLQAGPNVFVVFALDSSDNKSPSRSITIIYEPGAVSSGTGSTVISSSQPSLKQNPPLTPGVLTVDKPSSGISATTSEKETVIEGRTSAQTASISINGYTLSLYQSGKTTWNYIASTEYGTMKRGKNVYRIVARNAGGEILDILEYTMTFNP